jgi:uncharacterized protein YkwD
MSPQKRVKSVTITLIFGIALLSFLVGASQRLALSAPSAGLTAYLPLLSKVEPAPTPTATPTQPPQVDWLSYLNYLRSLGGLAAVNENTDWSNGCWLHSRYMVKNDEIGHEETPGNPWYTEEGNTAAANSNVMVSSTTSASDEYAINLWVSGPFHGISTIDPQLETVGFGSYREAIGTWQMGATLDVLRGRTTAEPPAGTYPVMWPGDGQTTPILSFGGAEWPDPLASCSGYTAPTGPPIYLQIGSGGMTPNVTATSFQQGSTSLSHCVFDETSYVNPDNGAQNLGRQILGSRDAIILMPQQPLVAGQTYTVSITSNSNTYTWSFSAGNGTQQQFTFDDAMLPAQHK